PFDLFRQNSLPTMLADDKTADYTCQAKTLQAIIYLALLLSAKYFCQTREEPRPGHSDAGYMPNMSRRRYLPPYGTYRKR
ncbi:MAG: hypothetical protein AAF975_01645, partial [Spirochaetota bacterium]